MQPNSKKQIIESVTKAMDRVMKASEDAGAVRAALEQVVKYAELGKAAVTSGVIDYETLWKHVGSCFAILDSIYMGYPMVPAEAASETAKAFIEAVKAMKGTVQKQMTFPELIEHACAEVEALAKLKKREEIAPRILCLKAAIFAWEQLPEGETITNVTMSDLTAANGDNARTHQEMTPEGAAGTSAGTYGFAKALARLEAIKPITKNDAAPPAKAIWQSDLTREKV